MDFWSWIVEKNTVSIWGMKGYGKTFLSALIVNADKNRRYLVLDRVGAYTTDKLVKNALYINVKQYLNDGMLTRIFKQWQKVGTKDLVLNLESFTGKELSISADVLFNWLMRTKPQIGVVIDEIPEYTPQKGKFYSAETERAVRIGRNYGLKPFILITQRPQETAKAILDLSQITIIFKLLHKRSRDKVKELLGFNDAQFKEVEELMSKLKKAQALVVDEELNYEVYDFYVKG
jgi:hypothetical protein